LRPEIYTESVDGEALLWAAERLQKSGYSKAVNGKVILFSDGCPMDRASIQANGEDFLRDHLIDVLTWYEQQANLELWACGIGSEMRPFFKHRLSWDPLTDETSDGLKNWATEFKKNIGR
jgi:cobaltochelatase CobT